MATFAILFAALAMIRNNFDKVKKGLEGVEKSSDGVTSAEAQLDAAAEQTTKSVAALNAAADTAANNLKETEAGELEVDASSISVASIDNFNLQNELTIQAQNVVLHGDKVSDTGGADAASASASTSDSAIQAEIKSRERSTKIRQGKLDKIGTTQTKDESTKIGQSFAREKEIKEKIQAQKDRLKSTTGPGGTELVPTPQVEGDAKGQIELLNAELEAEKETRRKLREEIAEHNRVIAENEERVKALRAEQEAAKVTVNDNLTLKPTDEELLPIVEAPKVQGLSQCHIKMFYRGVSKISRVKAHPKPSGVSIHATTVNSVPQPERGNQGGT